MYVAIISKLNVLEIASDEASSLEGLNVYANLGYPSLRRIYTTEKAFVDFSHGKTLSMDIKMVNGKAIPIIV